MMPDRTTLLQSGDNSPCLIVNKPSLLQLFTQQMPAKLINAVACILEDIAAKVRVFGITRTTFVPYVSYLTHDGRSVSGFIKGEILSKFKGTHIGYNSGTLTITDLATGSQQVAKLEYGDRIRVLVDRYNLGHLELEGQVVNILPGGWVRIKVGTGLFWYPENELLLVEKFLGWKNLADSPEESSLESGLRDWSKEPDEELFAAAAEAKRDLGF